MSRFLALMCQFCLHMPVPKVPSRGQVVCAGAREQELRSHGAQCPLQVSLALAAPPSFCLGLSNVPHAPQVVLAGTNKAILVRYLCRAGL